MKESYIEVNKQEKILVILGPTATGKTNLALQLASKFDGEIISVDSRQVYTGLDIGTGKLPGNKKDKESEFKIKKEKKYWEIKGIKIWMYDVVDFKKQYDVSLFVKETQRIIEKIQTRAKLPILVGGTGFYLKALLEGMSNLNIPVDWDLRKKLNNLSVEELQDQLKKISETKWKSLNISDKNNPRRLVRAIELEMGTKGKRLSYPLKPPPLSAKFNILKIGLTAPRKILYELIDKRVEERMNQGMVEEAKNLLEKGLSIKRMKQLGLEYGVMAAYFEGDIKDRPDLIKVFKGKIHGFARRQITWFKKEKNINWVDITTKNWGVKVEKQVRIWYDLADATQD